MFKLFLINYILKKETKWLKFFERGGKKRRKRGKGEEYEEEKRRKR